MSKPLRIGLAGVGTVGLGVIRLIDESGDLIAAKSGCSLVVHAVSGRERGKPRKRDIGRFKWHPDPRMLAADPDIDIFVEVMGGGDGVALDAVSAALTAGKPVVTANKALLALHGARLAELAERQGVSLAFEAAVAGGIPIVKTLKEGLVGNRVTRLYGILNGTCNYILTQMEASGRGFEAVLAEAQRKGYAEADPTVDIGGIDTAHKLTLLASLAFGSVPDFAGVFIEGIERVSIVDIAMARELGYRIKLLGLASITDHGVEQRVHPCFVPLNRPIAAVEDVTNAIVVEADRVGRIVLEGPGAGGEATASAIVADLVDVARGAALPPFGVAAHALARLDAASMDRHQGAYYLRLTALDRPGVMAAVTEDLAKEGVSIESIIQRGGEHRQQVPIILVTHECRESAMKKAVARIAAHESIVEPPRLIRIEHI